MDQSVLYEQSYGFAIFPLCIPMQTFQVINHVAFGQAVYALGYGYIARDDSTATLVAINQETISPAACEEAHLHVIPPIASKLNNTQEPFHGMICATNKKDNRAFQIPGDSGGPLLKTGSIAYQVAVYRGRHRTSPQIYSSLDDCSNLNFVRNIAFGDELQTCHGILQCYGYTDC